MKTKRAEQDGGERRDSRFWWLVVGVLLLSGVGITASTLLSADGDGRAMWCVSALGAVVLAGLPWTRGLPGGGARRLLRYVVRAAALAALALNVAIASGTWAAAAGAAATRARDYRRANDLFAGVVEDFESPGPEVRGAICAKITSKGILWRDRTSVYYDMGVNSIMLDDPEKGRRLLKMALESAGPDGRSPEDIADVRETLRSVE